MSKKSFVEEFGLEIRSHHNPKSTNAPIVFLLGTSTAGKGTICAEILRQDQDPLNNKKTGCRVWGTDLEGVEYLPIFLKRAEEVGMRVFGDNEKFRELSGKIAPIGAIIHGVGQDCFRDEASGKSLPLLSLNDREFDEAAGQFLENTNGKYDRDTLLQLRGLAQEEGRNFGRALGDISMPNMFERTLDRAIENSKKGIPTILDIIPDGSEDFKKLFEEKNFLCPIHVALIHLPISELAARMDERNKSAVAEENLSNRREGMFPFEQYAQIFGATAEADEKPVIDVLKALDVYQAVEKFGDKDGVKIHDIKSTTEDHKSQMAAVFTTLQEGKKLLDKIGFEDGSPALDVSAKIDADMVYDHASESTVAIASKIHNWIADQAEISKSAIEKPKTFVEKMASKTSGGAHSLAL